MTGAGPHSAQPPAAPAGGRPGRSRRAQPNGWWGMALFICSEATIFGTLMSSYFYLDFDSAHWPPAGITPPQVTAPVIATAVLIATAPLLWLALRAARAGRRWPAVRLIACALVIQSAYLAAQVLLYIHDLNDFLPRQNAYASVYFTLLALHHAHVLLGIALDLAVGYKLAVRGLDGYWLIGVRALALYWYAVCALGVLVLLTVLSPSL